MNATLPGRLIVVEGPENTGKSTFAADLMAELQRTKINVCGLSFPGREPRTLGALVYRTEHDAASLGLDPATPIARQALHLAAHLDGIERHFIPLLKAGTWIVLDRFWWSMWAHGVASGVPRSLLDQMIAIELAVWGTHRPAIIFSTTRCLPFAETATSPWLAVQSAYQQLQESQSATQLIVSFNPQEDRAARIQRAKARLLPISSPA